MFGIKDPIIRERTWLEGGCDREVTADTFWGVMQYADQLHARVHEWSGTDRDGKPMAIVWWAGKRAGQLYACYEFTPGGE